MSLQKSQVKRRPFIASMDPRMKGAACVPPVGGEGQGDGLRQGWIGCVKCCILSFEHTSQSLVIESEDSMT